MNNFQTDTNKLKKWNWAAFYLTPIWSIAHKLPVYTVLCFIPFVNFIVYIYLGVYGNRLAYPKSAYDTVDDFMEVQKYWNLWALRFIYITFILLILYIIF